MLHFSSDLSLISPHFQPQNHIIANVYLTHHALSIAMLLLENVSLWFNGPCLPSRMVVKSSNLSSSENLFTSHWMMDLNIRLIDEIYLWETNSCCSLAYLH